MVQISVARIDPILEVEIVAEEPPCSEGSRRPKVVDRWPDRPVRRTTIQAGAQNAEVPVNRAMTIPQSTHPLSNTVPRGWVKRVKKPDLSGWKGRAI